MSVDKPTFKYVREDKENLVYHFQMKSRHACSGGGKKKKKKNFFLI
jgi:hypothetical protein